MISSDFICTFIGLKKNSKKDGEIDKIVWKTILESHDARERYYLQLLPYVNKNKNQGLINDLGQKEYKKQHYKANKEQTQQRNEQLFKCQCGCAIQRISDKATLQINQTPNMACRAFNNSLIQSP